MAISDDKAYSARPMTAEHLGGVLSRNSRLLISITLLSVLAGIAVIILMPPKYVASGRILFDPVGLNIVGTGITPRITTGDSRAIEAESQVYILTSQTIFEKVIAAEHLETNPLFAAKPRNPISSLLAMLGITNPADPRAVALRKLNRAVTVNRNTNSFVVNVNVSTEDRATSAKIANAIMNVYLGEEKRAQAEAAGRAGSSLDTRLEALRKNVRDAEERYERYRSSQGIVMANGQSVLEKQVADLAEQITAAETRVTERQSTLDQMRKARNNIDTLPEAFRAGAIEVLRARYAAAKQAESNVAATLGPRHPEYVTASAQATAARRLLDQAIEDAIRSNSVELQRAQETVSGLKARLQQINSQLNTSNEASVKLRELGRDVDANRAVYDSFLSRSRELAEQQKLESSNTRILSYASPPLDAGGPSPLLVLLASLLMGLGLGTAAAWFREQLAAPWSPGMRT